MSERPPRAAEPLIAAAVAFLRHHPPFDEMEEEALRFLARDLSLAYYPEGTPVFGPEHGPPACLYIIQRGVVQRADGAPSGNGPITALRAGECFPIGALLEGQAGESRYAAVADTFCYQFPASKLAELMRLSPRFQAFTTRHLATLLRESRRLLAMNLASLAGEEQAMNRSLRSLIRRPPVQCGATATIGDALRGMAAARTGSILVVHADGSLAGILTRYDVLERVALARAGLEQTVATVMTPGPRTLPADATVHDAALLIAREGFRHLPVLDGQRVLGVVTERDLFALQQASMRGINRTILEASSHEALRHAAAGIRRLARHLAQQGLAAEQLTMIVSTLNDALLGRIIELEIAGHPGLAGIEWCWLAFGSEGRYEQTISTDQDNGIIFADAAARSAGEARARLLPFAQAVNRTLDACGFPLCKGNIMAGNPECCLSLGEWRERFRQWILHPGEQQLLNAVIFFDFRPLHGAQDLAAALRAALLELAPSRPAFLRQLARHALEVRPPLGLLSDFDTEDAPDAPGTLDLKKSGARLFVDAARVLGLATETAHPNTAQRLRHAGPRLNMSAEEISSATEAFFFIQTLRLRAQLLDDGRAGAGSPNRLDPQQLNEVDRRVLKESLRQAQRLQSRLALDYQL